VGENLGAEKGTYSMQDGIPASWLVSLLLPAAYWWVGELKWLGLTGLRGAPPVYAGGRADDSVKSVQRAVLFFWYSVPHVHSMKIDAETGTSGFLACIGAASRL